MKCNACFVKSGGYDWCCFGCLKPERLGGGLWFWQWSSGRVESARDVTDTWTFSTHEAFTRKWGSKPKARRTRPANLL